MRKTLSFIVLFAVAGTQSASATCSGCSTLEPQPTLANGDCANSSYNCKVYPRYVCDTTRLMNRTNCTIDFLTNPGTWSLMNSVGQVLGTFTGGSGRTINVNCGIRAVSTNLGMLLSFSTWTNGGTFSGWLNTQAVAESTTGNYDTVPANPGGDVSTWHLKASDNSIYLDGAGNSFTVTGPAGCSSGELALHYLTRNGNNTMIYNLPGTGYGSGTEGIRPAAGAYNFYRYTSVTSVDRALYNCNIGAYSSRVLKFLYGRMWEKQIARDGSIVIMSRRGWSAIDCLIAGAGASDY
ncbi:MAG: hypothetical protein ACR2IE_05160 [Candidatus Sumerlaeaceae bacterium]